MNGDNAGSIKYTPGSATRIQGICPGGWHVPSDQEWKVLTNFLGGENVAGGKMKEIMRYWDSPNTGATNSSGFSGIPGGVRSYRGYSGDSFFYVGSEASFWSATENSGGFAWGRRISSSRITVNTVSFDRTVGFSVRCMRDDQTGGEIVCENGLATDTMCSDGNFQVISHSLPMVNGIVRYEWYMRRDTETWTKISGAEGPEFTATWTYGNSTSSDIVFEFYRKAIGLKGEEYTSSVVSIMVPGIRLNLSLDDVQIDACDNAVTVTASGVSGAVYQWTYNRTSLSATNTYTPSRSDFGGNTGNYTVTCTATASGCQTEQSLVVYVAPVNIICPVTVQDKDGNIYPTVKIGCQCWTGKNMNVGTRVADTDYNTHATAGIQKICYNNDENYCNQYGGLYSWDETVNGDNVNAIKYSPGSTTQIQGICPNGWHVPSDAEWKVLEMSLGMIREQVDADGYRGTDQGTQLKEEGIFDSYDWCSGLDCNKSGFNGRPGGYRNSSGGSFYGVGSNAWFWSATEGGSSAWFRYLFYSMASVYRYPDSKAYGFSVRCVRN